jgi:hypothetical protein
LNAYSEKNDYIKDKKLNIFQGLPGKAGNYVKNFEFYVQLIEHFADIKRATRFPVGRNF